MAQMTSVGCISTTSGGEIISADDVGMESTWQYAAFARGFLLNKIVKHDVNTVYPKKILAHRNLERLKMEPKYEPMCFEGDWTLPIIWEYDDSFLGILWMFFIVH